MTGGTHQARVVRRLRGGAYGAWVICDGCPGWERAAWSDDHAVALAGQHNRTPNDVAIAKEFLSELDDGQWRDQASIIRDSGEAS